MAHAIVEYSANLEDKVDLDNLISTVHEACLNTGVFPLTGMRTRGARRDYYKIANGKIDACFIHLQLKLGPGREEEVKKKAMEKVFEALRAFVQPLMDTSPLALSIEVFELPAVLRVNKHNLADYVSSEEANIGKKGAANA